MISNLLLYLFCASALGGAVVMLIARHPMRVALALIATMLSLGGVYGLVGVHVIAIFQVLIYVGAVMVFMVYVIMLLNVGDQSFLRRYSRQLVPGIGGFALLAGALAYAFWNAVADTPATTGTSSFGVQAFSLEFLSEYWLHFELVSVLLVAAVVAAVAVIKVGSGNRG